MEDQTPKKNVKTEGQPALFGLDLDEQNNNKLLTVVNAMIDYRYQCQGLIEHQENSRRAVPEATLKLLP